jgi:hypothetical protein
MTEPTHAHNCDRCRYLGTGPNEVQGAPAIDYYACPGSGMFGPILKRRFSGLPDDWGGVPVMYADGDRRYEIPLRIYRERSAAAKAKAQTKDGE